MLYDHHTNLRRPTWKKIKRSYFRMLGEWKYISVWLLIYYTDYPFFIVLKPKSEWKLSKASFKTKPLGQQTFNYYTNNVSKSHKQGQISVNYVSVGFYLIGNKLRLLQQGIYKVVPQLSVGNMACPRPSARAANGSAGRSDRPTRPDRLNWKWTSNRDCNSWRFIARLTD